MFAANRILGIAWLALFVATLALFVGARRARWEPTGRDLLAPSMEGDPGSIGDWETPSPPYAQRDADEPDRLLLRVDREHPGSYAFRRLRLPASRQFLLKGEVRTRGIRADRGAASRARLLAVSVGDHGRPLYHRSHLALRLPSDTPWQNVSAPITVWNDVDTLEIALHVQAAQGEVELRAPRLFVAVENTTFRWVRRALACGWILWLGMVTPRLLRKLRPDLPRRRSLSILAGTMLLIFVGCLVPERWRETLSNPLTYVGALVATDATPKVDQEPRGEIQSTGKPTTPHIGRELPKRSRLRSLSSAVTRKLVRKGGHFALYLILVLVFLWVTGCSRREALSFCLLIALTSEVLQYFSHGRDPRLLDVGIDLVGGLVAVLAWPRIAPNVPQQELREQPALSAGETTH